LTQIVKSEEEDVYVIGWTPWGRYLWWISQADNGPVIWLSDPCGQSPPKKVFDPADYPDFRFDRIAYGWLDEHTLFLNGQQRTSRGTREGVWRFDLTTGQLTLWHPGYAMDRALSEHVALLWHPQGGFRLWAWGEYYPAPPGLTLLNDDTVRVAPDERWLVWRREDGWYVAPLGPQAEPRFEKARRLPTDGNFVSWMSEGPALVFYSTESLPNEQVRYIFQIIDPAEGVVTRTIAFVSPLIRTLPPFVPGPYGRRVALDVVVDSPDQASFKAYIEVWDLITGERRRIYEASRGVLDVWAWGLVDVEACPWPPQTTR